MQISPLRAKRTKLTAAHCPKHATRLTCLTRNVLQAHGIYNIASKSCDYDLFRPQVDAVDGMMQMIRLLNAIVNRLFGRGQRNLPPVYLGIPIIVLI